MRAIFLGAGSGTRLQPLTTTMPKWMLEVNGQPLLQHGVNVMHECDVTEVVVVRGRLGGRIKTPSVAYRDDLDSNNMVHTLFSVQDQFTDDMIVSYCDILYEPRLVKALQGSKATISVVVDRAWAHYFGRRAGNPLRIAESCVIEDGILKELGQLLRDDRLPEAQYVGLMRFASRSADQLRTIYRELKHDFSGKPWRNAVTFEKAFMTDFLQELIDRGISVEAVEVDGGWLEFDTVQDYELVQNWINDGTIRNLIDLESLPKHPAVLSAGGVISRRSAKDALEVLVVGTGDAGEWRVPKGMQDPLESIKETALREVQEESGVRGVIDGYLGRLQWSYDYGGSRWDERVHFFSMHAKEAVTPLLTDGEHKVAAWLKIDEAIQGMKYDGERSLISKTKAQSKGAQIAP